VCGARGGRIVKFLGVEGEAEGSLHTRAKVLGVTKSEDTSVVDLSLQKCSTVEVTMKEC
jgi:hypothetical protein